jgi:glutamate dehydrogenase/leucine dehydrogenase
MVPTDTLKLNCTPEALIQAMVEADVKLGYIVHDSKTKKMQVSHELFQPLAESIQAMNDFYEHEAIFLQVGSKSNTLFGAFIHKSKRGAGHGGVRLWQYNTIDAFVREGLRLSLGMTRKNAAAGLWWGGGKGLILLTESLAGRLESDPNVRQTVFNEYGQFVTQLQGCFYAAEDVNLNVNDVEEIRRETRFVTCIPTEKGGSGNPSHYTARGVISGMEAAVMFYANSHGQSVDTEHPLKDKTIAVQGAGNVASFLIDELVKHGVKKVIVADISQEAITRVMIKHANSVVECRVVSKEDNSVLFESVDILAPCALGGVLNDKTIPHIKARIICGAANNQLLNPEDDKALLERGIVYVPDFIVNRMGIVHCSNENYGYIRKSVDASLVKHFNREYEHGIYRVVQNILNESSVTNVPTGVVANRIADEKSEELHPLWGHRAWEIIQDVVRQ